MTDPRIRLLFTRAQLIAMHRCPDCGWHPTTQGHHSQCPGDTSSAPTTSRQQHSELPTTTQEL